MVYVYYRICSEIDDCILQYNMYGIYRSQPVHRGKSRNKQTQPVFMFTLRVADSSGETDVVCYDKEAEFLLGGVSAEAFSQRDVLRSTVENTLQDCINSKITMDFYLWSYKIIHSKPKEKRVSKANTAKHKTSLKKAEELAK